MGGGELICTQSGGKITVFVNSNPSVNDFELTTKVRTNPDL